MSKHLLHIGVVAFSFLFAQQTVRADWTQTNGPQTANIGGLTTLGSILFGRSALAGVFRTSDGGASWGLTSNTLPGSTGMASIASSEGSLFAGTFDGVYRSADSGKTWVAVKTGLPKYADVSILVAIDSVVIAGGYHGLFRSTNLGEQWYPANTGLGDTDIIALCANESVIVVGTNSAGVFVSTNKGAAWSAAADFWPSSPALALYNNTRNNWIYAGTNHGVYYSSNSGAQWLPANAGWGGSLVKCITMIGSTLLVGTWQGLNSSTDNGDSWILAPGKLATRRVYGFATIGTTVYAGTNYGVYATADSGKTWAVKNSGLGGAEVRSFVSVGDNIYAGCTGSVFLTTDKGDAWIEDSTGMGNEPINSLVEDQGILFAGMFNEGMFRSMDGGQHWEGANANWGNHSFASLITVGDTIFAGGFNGISITPNAGDYWTTPDVNVLTGTLVSSLGKTGGIVFAGTSGYYTNGAYKPSAGVFRSTDGGLNWSAANNGLTDSNVAALASIGETVFAGTYAGVFVSTDSGMSWILGGSGGFMPKNISCFATSDNFLFAGNTNGMAMSSDMGATWKNISGSMKKYAYALTISGGYLYAGTSTGVWKQPLSEITGVQDDARVEMPQEMVLHQNSPNPFSGTTSMEFSLSRTQHATLSVFNSVGELVATLIDGETTGGTHTASFNAAGLKSGVYWCRLIAGGNVRAMPMVVLR